MGRSGGRGVRGWEGAWVLLGHPLQEGSWQAPGLVENGLQGQGEGGWRELAGAGHILGWNL